MIEDFSAGYYRTQMRVQEYEDGPVIQQDVYDFINRTLYLDSTKPVMMRLSLDAGDKFVVEAENAIPQDVLALPSKYIDERGMTDIFVLKSDYLDTVGEYYG